MYAVIETGGKQYRVEVGTELEVELLSAGPGESVAFDRVLLVADGDAASIGRPVLANASVAGEVVRRSRGEKVVSFKYRPKARRRVKKGHRQELTLIRIRDIVLDGKSAAKEHAQAEEARLTERQRLEEGARRQAAKDAELAAKLATDAKAAEGKSAPAKRGTGPAKADTTDAGAARKTTARASTTGRTPAKATGKAATSGKASTGAKTAATGQAEKTDKADKAETKTSTRTTSRTRKGGEE